MVCTTLDDKPLLNEKNGLEDFLTENKLYNDNFYIRAKNIFGRKYTLKLSVSSEYCVFILFLMHISIIWSERMKFSIMI